MFERGALVLLWGGGRWDDSVFEERDVSYMCLFKEMVMGGGQEMWEQQMR